MRVTYTCEVCGCPCIFTQHFRQRGEPGIPKFCPMDIPGERGIAKWKKTANPKGKKEEVVE